MIGARRLAVLPHPPPILCGEKISATILAAAVRTRLFGRSISRHGPALA